MLAIRMQRTGRKGYPMYRVVVQDSHRQPTSGRVVANLGSYNPHTKESTLDKEKAATFLKNGAQPSDRVVKLLKAEKVALPAWVKVTSDKKQKVLKNAEKLRRNQPKEEAPVAEAEEVAEATAEEATPEVEETTEA
jgi:small subunit ribosomal protein S16